MNPFIFLEIVSESGELNLQWEGDYPPPFSRCLSISKQFIRATKIIFYWGNTINMRENYYVMSPGLCDASNAIHSQFVIKFCNNNYKAEPIFGGIK